MSREAFEKWAEGKCETHRHDGAKDYSSNYTRFAWQAWQAAQQQHSGMVSVPVDCGCGDSYLPNSYSAGWIHAIGNCPNCEAAKSAAQEQQ